MNSCVPCAAAATGGAATVPAPVPASATRRVPQKLHITSPGCALPPHTGHSITLADGAADSLSSPDSAADGFASPTATNAVPSVSQKLSLSGYSLPHRGQVFMAQARLRTPLRLAQIDDMCATIAKPTPHRPVSAAKPVGA